MRYDITNELTQTLLQGNAAYQSVEDVRLLAIPEISSGFVKAPWIQIPFPLPQLSGAGDMQSMIASANQRSGLSPDERQWPVWFHAPLDAPGQYMVTIRLTVLRPCHVMLFANHRQLIFAMDAHAPCEAEVRFHLHMGRIIPRGMSEPHAHRSLDVCLFGAARLTCVDVERSNAPTVFVMGDSTVTDQSAEAPWSPLTSYSGWGQMLPAFLREAAVSNHAHSGLTTESFRTEGHWDVMRTEVRPGDTVLMQFGHNDQKLPHLKAMEGYAANLRRYIDDLRAMGAIPVLVTPLARNTWFADGTYNDLLAAYADAVNETGKQTQTPVIDLHRYSMDFLCAHGMEQARNYFYPGDYTHTNDHGAYLMAAFVAGELHKLCLPHGAVWNRLPSWPPNKHYDRTLPPKALRAEARFDWHANQSLLPDSLDRPDDPITRAEAFEMVVKACRFFGVNVYNDAFDDVTGHETWAGMIEAAQQNGLIPPEMVDHKRLEPERPIAPFEFAAVLIRGALARMPVWQPCDVPGSIPAFARSAVGLLAGKRLWKDRYTMQAAMTRSDALSLCKALMDDTAKQ